MGRQRGVVHLSGQFGDVQLSIYHGKGIAKMSIPVSKQRIATDPNYEQTRKINSEFKAVSLAVDGLAECFGGNGYDFGDRYMRARLMALGKKIIKKGPGLHGQRTFEVAPNLNMFREWELNMDDKFRNRFKEKCVVTVYLDRNTATLVVPPFLTNRSKLNAPQGATHFRVCLAVGVLCDVEYGGSDVGYEPVDATISGLNDVSFTPVLDGAGVLNPGFQLITEVPGLPVLPSTAGLVVSVGIEFFMVINSVPELLAQGNAMRIHAIY
jgi:hypothetical protein